jgi:hypothetical protein
MGRIERDIGSAGAMAAALVDLAAYPIDDLAAEPGAALVARCRARFAEAGVLALPGFLTPEATALLAAEAVSLEGAAHHYAAEHTVYFEPPDEALPPGHPRRTTVVTDKGNVPYDLIPRTSLVRAFYEWDAVLAFLSAVLDEPDLARHPDPMAALNINVHGEGQGLGWHFDRAEFAVTLALQPSEVGGVFEYAPGLRSADDENYAGVAEVIAGRSAAVQVLEAPPGTLSLFRGRHSLHRVTPSHGPSKRLLAALSYVREPTPVFSAYARNLFYGRETPVRPPEA